MNRHDQELAAHHPWLRRLARRLARSSARADDLVQDTCVTALRNAPPDAQLRPWLHAVMRKLAWGQVRSEQRRLQREESFSLTAPALTLPDVLPDHGVDRERLSAAVAGLPEPFHSTIVECFLNGRSCADIARRENVPAGTVRWRQARGLELLRAELAPPSRRLVIWALPFLSAGEQLVARCCQSLAARLSGSKALWLGLACAAVLYAIVGGGRPDDRSANEGDDSRDGLALADVSLDHAGVGAPVGGVLRVAPGTREAGQGAGMAAGLFAATASEGARPPDRDFARAAFGSALDIDRDDCTWDPVHGRRCAAASSSAAATCARVRRQLVASEGLVPSSAAARGILAAAAQANRALAQQLGCPWEGIDGGLGAGPGGKPDRGRSGGGRPGDSGKPAANPPDENPPGEGPSDCTTVTGVDNAPCTVCPGQTPVCAPVDCQSRMIATGIVCVSCSNSIGLVFTDCPAVQVANCQSEISESGLVCSTCDDQPGPPECLPAECTVVTGGCLRCVDPKARVGVDCSMDYSVFAGGKIGGSAIDSFFGSCDLSWGPPHVTGITCHYVGTQSCVANEYEDEWQCLHCEYRNGSGTGLCMGTSEPLPDPMADRPLHLPPPGQCVTDQSADGSVSCATCTRADLSATSSCRYRDVTTCYMNPFLTEPGCLGTCEQADGRRVPMCKAALDDVPVAQASR